MNIMKKKAITFVLLGLLGISSIIPLTAKAGETWNYGYDSSKMQWYNHYYHTDYRHFGSISKNNLTYYGPVANPGYWSKLNLDFNGPYAVTYQKYVIR